VELPVLALGGVEVLAKPGGLLARVKIESIADDGRSQEAKREDEGFFHGGKGTASAGSQAAV
jgi:hypothetical protein